MTKVWLIAGRSANEVVTVVGPAGVAVAALVVVVVPSAFLVTVVVVVDEAFVVVVTTVKFGRFAGPGPARYFTSIDVGAPFIVAAATKFAGIIVVVVVVLMPLFKSTGGGELDDELAG